MVIGDMRSVCQIVRDPIDLTKLFSTDRIMQFHSGEWLAYRFQVLLVFFLTGRIVFLKPCPVAVCI